MCIFRCFRRHALIVIAAQFRRQHEQLSSVIAKVLKVSGRNAGENEGIIDTADKDAIEEVELAYKDVKVIDYLDISEQGNQQWESAKKRCGE